MGAMLRRYWLPALMSSELIADGAPKRVHLLGERLVAFRDSRGVVGLLDENCPHHRSGYGEPGFDSATRTPWPSLRRKPAPMLLASLLRKSSISRGRIPVARMKIVAFARITQM